jgi:uncharacterized membrane protein YedE/YeeE
VSEFWPFWAGGAVVGAVATLYPLASGRLLGVSSLYASLFEKRSRQAPLSELEAALLAETEAEFGPQPAAEVPRGFSDKLARLRADAERFRPLFLIGILLGGALAAWLASELTPKLTLGRSFDLRYGSFGPLPIAVLFVSGILIGAGTRLAGGCTSGHGISGVARGERGSWVTTMVFWATALGVAWIFYWLKAR